MKFTKSLHCILSTCILLLCCFLASCQNENRQDPTPLIDIVATTGIVGDLVRAVGGDKVSVIDLMGPGIDPHLYRATQGDLTALTNAELIYYNGLHLEGKMTEVLASFSNRKPCLAVSQNIDSKLLRSPPEYSGNYDPHIWFDVSLWQQALHFIAFDLQKRFPEHNDYFAARFQEANTKMTVLHEWVKQEIALIPKSQRILITAHDAFGYFGRAYDIEVLGLQGISTASEFGLNDIKRVSDVILKSHIKAVFVESSVPERLMQALAQSVQAQGWQVTIGGSLYSDALGPRTSAEASYEGMVRYNVQTIVKALK